MQYGLILTEKEWEEEWDTILRLASAEPRSAFSSSPNSSTSTNNSGVTNSSSKGATSSGRRRSRLSVVAMSSNAFAGGGVCAMGSENASHLVRDILLNTE